MGIATLHLTRKGEFQMKRGGRGYRLLINLLAIGLLVLAGGEALGASDTAIAVGAHGHVYVANLLDGGIEVFTNSGVRVGGWRARGMAEGWLFTMTGIAIGNDGRVYVINWERVQVFSPDGKHLREWRLPRDIAGGDIGIGKDGSVYVINAFVWISIKSTYGILMMKFGPDGRLHRRIAQPVRLLQKEAIPADIAIGPAEEVYVLMDEGSRHLPHLHMFSPSGRYIGEWGGWKKERPNMPSDLAVDTKGNVYVVDSPHVFKFDPTGRVKKLGPFFVQRPPGFELESIALASTGEMYVLCSPSADDASPAILRLSPDGRVLAHWTVNAPASSTTTPPARPGLNTPTGRE